MSYEFFSETKPRARKVHRCDLCERDIAVGEQHVARRGKFDGHVYTYRMHQACCDLTKDWDEDDWSATEPCEFRASLTRKD